MAEFYFERESTTPASVLLALFLECKLCSGALGRKKNKDSNLFHLANGLYQSVQGRSPPQ